MTLDGRPQNPDTQPARFLALSHAPGLEVGAIRQVQPLGKLP
jgi:hypothetical protein